MSDDQNWFANDQFWAIFGDCMFRPETFREARQEIDKIRTLSGIHHGDVLDLGCGPGRHSIPLSEAGFAVTAVDLSETLLTQGQASAGDNDTIEWVKADMRSFCRPDSYDLAISMWTSFGYFDQVDDDLQVLTQIRSSLRSQGRLLLDVVGKEYVLRNLQPVHLTDFDDGTVLIERPVLSDEMCRYHNEWTLIREGQAHTAEWSQNLYTAQELRTLLTQAGFKDIEVYGSLDADDYDIDAERLVVVATAEK